MNYLILFVARADSEALVNDMPDKIVTNPVKAIRLKCLDCCCGSFTEVEQCTAQRCPLFPFRFGKNPYRTKREMSDEQKEALRRRLKDITEKRYGSADESATDDAD